MSEPIIRIVYTVEDVEAMAEAAGIELDLAQERAMAWSKHIADTAMGIISEQLASVIANDQP